MKKKQFSIVSILTIFILVIFLVQGVISRGIIHHGNTTEYMKETEQNLFSSRVATRRDYLKEKMLGQFSDIEKYAQEINAIAESQREQGILDVDSLDRDSSESLLFLEASSKVLIEMIRNNKVSGAILVLNTEDLSASEIKDKPGLYLRDYDPTSSAWQRDKNLLWCCAPAQFIRNQDLSTDEDWQQNFKFSEGLQCASFFYEPYQAAYDLENRQNIDLTDYGYWGCNNEGISYSIPLILEDGTVYGVLGIDLLPDYLNKLLPYQELVDNSNEGSYVLGIQWGKEEAVEPVHISGENDRWLTDDKIHYEKENGQLYVKAQDPRSCLDIAELNLYNESSPFYSQRWVVMGIVDESQLFMFTNHFIHMFQAILVISLLLGAAAGIVGIIHISRPIKKLSLEVEEARPNQPFTLTETHISEIDQLSQALLRQSSRLNQVMEKFSNIINMADISLAVFEVDYEDKTVFITDKFFQIFDLPERDTQDMTIKEFLDVFSELTVYKKSDSDEVIYRVGERFVRTRFHQTDQCYLGFAEDVTSQVRSLKQMEYERNHDVMTRLVNRRYFMELAKEKLSELSGGSRGKTGAFIMMDLDNLKYVNDTFGHEYGDVYIKKVAECFHRMERQQAVISRLAGDEFCVFLYGYEGKEAVLKWRDTLSAYIEEAYIVLKDGGRYPLCISSGLAWYGEDGTTYEALLRCADERMYVEKKTKKSGER